MRFFSFAASVMALCSLLALPAIAADEDNFLLVKPFAVKAPPEYGYLGSSMPSIVMAFLQKKAREFSLPLPIADKDAAASLCREMKAPGVIWGVLEIAEEKAVLVVNITKNDGKTESKKYETPLNKLIPTVRQAGVEVSESIDASKTAKAREEKKSEPADSANAQMRPDNPPRNAQVDDPKDMVLAVVTPFLVVGGSEYAALGESIPAHLADKDSRVKCSVSLSKEHMSLGIKFVVKPDSQTPPPGAVLVWGTIIADNPAKQLELKLYFQDEGGHVSQRKHRLPQDKVAALPALALALLGQSATANPQVARSYTSHIRLAGIVCRAEAGSGDAQKFLSSLYEKGKDLPQDDAMALFWLKKSAENNFGASQLALAMRYLKGDGVEENKEKALELLFQAAENDQREAVELLFTMYAEGKTVSRDTAKAVALVEAFAERKPSESNAMMRELVQIYNDGVLVPANRAKAAWWLDKAVKAGDKDFILESSSSKIINGLCVDKQGKPFTGVLRLLAGQGLVRAEIMYIAGVQEGRRKDYHKNGDLLRQVMYASGKPGQIIFYEDGMEGVRTTHNALLEKMRGTIRKCGKALEAEAAKRLEARLNRLAGEGLFNALNDSLEQVDECKRGEMVSYLLDMQEAAYSNPNIAYSEEGDWPVTRPSPSN